MLPVHPTSTDLIDWVVANMAINDIVPTQNLILHSLQLVKEYNDKCSKDIVNRHIIDFAIAKTKIEIMREDMAEIREAIRSL